MKSLIIILILAAGMILAPGAQLQAQGITKAKTLTEGDTTFYTNLQTSKGQYKWCRATLYNPNATLYDTARIFHVTRFEGSTDSTFNQVGFKKLKVDTTTNFQALQNDTVYYKIVLAPLESVEVLLWFPFPDNFYFDLYNKVYNANRAMKIKTRFFNE